MKYCVHLWWPAEFALEWDVFDTRCREAQSTLFMLSNFLFPLRKSCHLWNNVEECGRDWQATDDSIIWRLRFACWLTKTADTLRMCDMYCSSSATMVARMDLSVTFCLHCLTCLLASSATKQVPTSYPPPSFRWFLSPRPHPSSFSLPELENGVVRYSCILGSRI
jgi:hypothetical protein